MKSRFIYIIIAIMLVLLVNPYLRPLGLFGHFFTTLILALIPLSCVFALTEYRKKALAILVIATPFVIIDGLHFFSTSHLSLIVELSLAIFLYFYIVFLLVKHLLSIRVVTADMIYCAISTYLLIGIGWAGIYDLVDIISPGSFSGKAEGDLLYFSFVTLTTLGFGDILPQSFLAQRLVIFEATMGSIYMAVIVAMIVGRYMSMQDSKDETILK
jgi:voltage-gated potassium channel Kch